MSENHESQLALALIIDALFCSDLQTDSNPTDRQLGAAIRDSLEKHNGWSGCTRVVTLTFGRDPTVATRRESWCRRVAVHALSKTFGIHSQVDQSD